MDHSPDCGEDNIHEEEGRELDIKEEPVLLIADDLNHQVERIAIKVEPQLFSDNLPSASSCSGIEEHCIYLKEERTLHIKEEPALVIDDDFCDTVASAWMVCFHCGHTSLSLGRLRKHIVWRRTRAVPPQLISENIYGSYLLSNVQKHFQCKLYSYSCRRFSWLKNHMLIHSEPKPFQCKSCSYSCRSSSDLKKHMLIHSGQKSFQCNWTEICSI